MRVGISIISGWFWGVGLIALSVLALVVLGWRGLEGQRAVVWDEAREDCVAWSELVARDLTRAVENPGRLVWLYEDAPEPGGVKYSREASDEVLERWYREEGMTEAGLPVKGLAGLELLRRKSAVVNVGEFLEWCLGPGASVVTPRLLEGLGGDEILWKEHWARDERARAVFRDAGRDGWVEDEGEILYFWTRTSGDDGMIGVSDAWKIEEVFERQGVRSDWLGMRVIVGGGEVGDGLARVLTNRDLGGARLELGVKDVEAVERSWRGQRQWMMMVLGVALLMVALGLWVMMRGVLKEKRSAYAKGQFVASVTHELRAPVGSMRLMADALDQGKVGTKKVAEFHRLMSRESGRLSVLIENVMDLARVEDGRRVIELEDVSLEDVVAEVCEMLAIQASENSVALSRSGEPLRVRVDAMGLRQILVNVIDNAVKFSPGGGRVDIEWKDLEENGWEVSVEDEGPGIAQEDRTRIFERFYRGEDELRRQTKGVGIGLSLVKELVELQGGRIVVENGGRGGSVFRFIFSKK